MPEPLSTGPPTLPLSTFLQNAGTHTHCRHCKERVSVSTPVAVAGWHTVHACTLQDTIEVNVRSPGAEPWAWRYAADALAASLLPPSPKRARHRSAP